MKIQKRDLDESIQKKLDSFDYLKDTLEEGKTSFVAYDGNIFFNKYFDEKKLNRITSDSEIRELSSYVESFVKKSGIKNSLSSSMNVNNTRTSFFKSLSYNEKPLAEIKLKTRIIKTKYIDENCLMLSDNGCAYWIDLKNRKSVLSINLVDLVKSKLAIEDFYTHDLLDVVIYNSGLLVSTINNGVFWIKDQNTIETIIPESNIIGFELYGDKLFCIIPRETDSVVIYDLISRKKIQSSNQLRRYRQIPIRIRKVGNKAFVLGRNFHVHDIEFIIHCWELDSEGLAFNNVDYKVTPLREKSHIIPKFIEVDEENLYLAAFSYDKLIVFKYSIINLAKYPEKREYHLSGLDFNKSESIFLMNNSIIASFDNKIIECSADSVNRVIYVKGNKYEFLNLNRKTSKLHTFSLGTLYEYDYQPEKNVPNLVLRVIKEEKPCNNFSILIKGKLQGLAYSIVSSEAKEIEHSAPITIKKENEEILFINVKDCKHNEVFMNIAFKPGNEITGVVVKRDHIYYEETVL